MTHVIQHSGIGDPVGNATQSGDCGIDPHDLTYSRARSIMRTHDRHVGCRQWVAAAAYLSAGLDYE